MTKTSQVDRITNVLARNTRTPGITPVALAKAARVSLDTVYKRVHDLRASGAPIYTNTRKVNGRSQTFYRMAS